LVEADRCPQVTRKEWLTLPRDQLDGQTFARRRRLLPCSRSSVRSERQIRRADQGVNLEVKAGEIVSLLGRNGIGRSTTCNSPSGVTRIRALRRRRISGCPRPATTRRPTWRPSAL
jgi:hypothetical protein